ncbi:MAG: hypothetical protein ACE5Z5_15440, partial [Candidatus Bathyarchaeia archaeon]
SGKAYYRLVAELKGRNIPFLSLRPTDTVPISVRVVITTAPERDSIQFSPVLVYDENEDPAAVVDEAVNITRGKRRYGEVVVGVDPGKRFGVAVVGDGAPLRYMRFFSVEGTAAGIAKVFGEVEADERVVRIGVGAKAYYERLVRLLDRMLPSDVRIEAVVEEGTTKNVGRLLRQRRLPRDVMSAVKISMRDGSEIERKKGHE